MDRCWLIVDYFFRCTSFYDFLFNFKRSDICTSNFSTCFLRIRNFIRENKKFHKTALSINMYKQLCVYIWCICIHHGAEHITWKWYDGHYVIFCPQNARWSASGDIWYANILFLLVVIYIISGTSQVSFFIFLFFSAFRFHDRISKHYEVCFSVSCMILTSSIV